jgi:parallel beta-helix repeat protein
MRPPFRSYSTLRVTGSYVAVIGLDVQGGAGHAIDGGNLAGGRPIRNHHVLIANNYVHDSGGGGIEMAWGDYYTIEGNLSERNCATNSYHASGISIYQLHAADSAPGFHNFVRFNVARFNAEGPTIPEHTDGNGIIIDDANNTQAGPTQSVPYRFQTLVEGNLAYGNGGKGIHIVWSNYVTARDNTLYKNNLDNTNPTVWRGELSNVSSSYTTLSNNIMVADPAINPHNTAIGDQTVPSKWPTAGVRWIGNLTFDGTPGSPSISVDGTKPVFVATLAGQDPKFIAPSLDPASANFNLDSTSPVLGAQSK